MQHYKLFSNALPQAVHVSYLHQHEQVRPAHKLSAGQEAEMLTA